MATTLSVLTLAAAIIWCLANFVPGVLPATAAILYLTDRHNKEAKTFFIAALLLGGAAGVAHVLLS